MRPVFILIFLATFIGASLLFLQRDAIADFFERAGLSHKEEGLTELYFNATDALPDGAGAATFSFSIHNQEGVDMAYDYVITAETSQRIIELDRGNVTLLDGTVTAIQKTVRIPLGTTRVVVALPAFDQKIAFLVH